MKNIQFLFLFTISALSLSAQNSSKLFDTLLNCPKDEKIRIAASIYYSTVEPLDSAETFYALNQLKAIANKTDDDELQVLETLFRGEFYYRKWDSTCMSYFKEGLEQAAKRKYNILKAQALHNSGLQLYRQNNYNLAFEHLLKANYIMKDYGYSKYPSIARYLTELGELYCQFGDYEKSKKLLEDAANFPSPNAIYGIRLNNTLGVCNRELSNLEAATQNFMTTIELAKAANEVQWVGIGTGNLGSIYYKLNRYNEAIPLLNIDYRVSLEHKQRESAFTSLCMLAEIYVSKANVDSAAYYLAKATAILDTVSYPVNYRSYYNARAGYYKLKGDYRQAFICLDSAIYFSKLLTKRDFANIKAKAEQKASVEKYLSEIELIQSKQQVEVVTRNAIITALILFLIIAGLIVRNLWLRRRNYKQQLLSATEQLNLYVENIREKTGLINQLETQLQSIDLRQNNQENITQLQNYTILTEDDWNEFRRLFEKVHSDFFVKLKQRYPTLTQSEVRLMALIKLNLGRKEMADMLGISPDSVKKTRQRVKKKIELPEDKDLEEIAFSI